MSSVLPYRFLFRFEYAARRIDALPRRKGLRPLDLPESCRLQDGGPLDGQAPFAHLSAAWNVHGVGFQLDVPQRSGRLECDPDKPEQSDGLRIWIDTRSTQNVHRATRFCHSFVAIPQGGGDDGRLPSAMQLPVPRAREDAPLCEPEDLLIAAEVLRDAYRLELWLPRDVLQGFDPDAQARLGFHYLIRDNVLGSQTPAVGADYPYETDPSLWSVLSLES